MDALLEEEREQVDEAPDPEANRVQVSSQGAGETSSSTCRSSLVVVPALPGLEYHDALRLDAALLALLDEALGRVAREPAQREAAALAVADRDHALGGAEEGRGAGGIGGPPRAPDAEGRHAAEGKGPGGQ